MQNFIVIYCLFVCQFQNKLAANLILSFANDYWGSTLLNVKTYLVSTLTLLIWVDNSKGGLKEGEGCIQTYFAIVKNKLIPL